MKENRGITLIALVVTIIILIILSGVTLAIVMGNGGLIERTKKAREDYTIGSIKERLELVEGNPYIDKQRKINLDEYFEALDEQKIEPYKVTNKEKKSEEVGIVEVDGKYSFVIRKEKDITIEYEGEVGKVDRTEPNIKIVLAGENKQLALPVKVKATITNNDEPINSAKWVLNSKNEEIGTNENSYTENLENTNTVNMQINEVDTYYLHILTKDKYGVKKETIKGPIVVSDDMHKHIDGASTVQASSYQSSSSGGCFTKENVSYTTKYRRCGGTYRFFGPAGQGSTTCSCDRCGRTITPGGTQLPGTIYSTNCGTQVPYQEATGKYYTLNCGKTEQTKEGYQISFDNN